MPKQSVTAQWQTSVVVTLIISLCMCNADAPRPCPRVSRQLMVGFVIGRSAWTKWLTENVFVSRMNTLHLETKCIMWANWSICMISFSQASLEAEVQRLLSGGGDGTEPPPPSSTPPPHGEQHYTQSFSDLFDRPGTSATGSRIYRNLPKRLKYQAPIKFYIRAFSFT